MNHLKIILLILLTYAFAKNMDAQLLWQDVEESRIPDKGIRYITPKKFKTYSLNENDLKQVLDTAPLERTEAANLNPTYFSMPMPDGTMKVFEIVNSPIMAPGLAARYSEIQTYAGYDIDNPVNTVRFDLTPKGFHAMVFTQEYGTVYIDPYSFDKKGHYIVYARKALGSSTPINFECGVLDNPTINENITKSLVETPLGDCTMRTYRIAIAATAEYTDFHGGTVANALAAQVTTMNRVNGIYMRDMAISMEIVDDNDDIIYTDAATDPYTNGDAGEMIGEAQTDCDNNIGNNNYDIGHVFGTIGGFSGLASLNVVCEDGSKARGVSTANSPMGDFFDAYLVPHEIGHQFGANHSYNNSCDNNRNNGTAYEAGAGSTIMGYAATGCTPRYTANADDYFHVISLEEISVRILNTNCAVEAALTNTAPTVNNVPTGLTIPGGTPFQMTANATDAEGDAITYCWEQFDNEISNQPPDPTSTNGPNFLSTPPQTSPTRYFPNLPDVIANNSPTWEVLSTVDRTFNFRVTVRDNAVGGGCSVFEESSINVDGNSGPFEVQSPSNPNIIWAANVSTPVTWDVAGTDNAPVNCANVDILLSTDGGLTYPTTLATNVPNDGSQDVQVPNNPTTTARVKIICSDNIFYDISNNNFAIIVPTAPDDAGISAVLSPQGAYCTNQVEGVVTLTNYGTNDLTSVDIIYDIDGANPVTETWSGTLASGASVDYSLGILTLPAGVHTFNVSTNNPNGNTDTDTANDANSSNFTAPAGQGQFVSLELITDDFGSETTWELTDENNNVLFLGGPYDDNTTINEAWCLAEGCYTWTIFDSFGDGICCGFGNGSYTINNETYGVTIGAGGEFINTDVVNFCITLPTITCPADVTVACSANIIPGVADFQTDCPAGGNVSVSNPVINGEPNCPGTTYTYTFTGTDECGQGALCEQVFTIVNDEPTISCPPDMMVTCPLEIVAGIPSFNTSCQLGGNVVTDGPVRDGNPGCDGTTYTYTFTGTDDCGRTVSCQQVFTIMNEGPTITCPAGGDITCEDDILLNDFAIVDSDCLLDTDTDRTGPVVVGDPDCDGTTYTYTYTTTDECGRTASCDQVFTIVNDGPTITCPADEIVECMVGDMTDVNNASFTTSCELGASVDISGPDIIGIPDCSGTTYTFTYTVTDDCGRTASCDQVFTIDNAGPTITCPSDATVECFADISVDESDASFTTSCSVVGSVSLSNPVIDGDPDCPGTTYTYTYTVTDVCGRTASCDQVFTIDNPPPTITCPADATVQCESNIFVTANDATFTTSCGLGGSLSLSGPVIDGDADCPGTTHTYTYTVTDDCGRTASCDQIFTIENDAPMITTCPEDCPVACANDIRPGTPEFTTSCGLGGTLSLLGPIVDGDPGCDGTTYTYTHVVTDDCGRVALCDQVFTIVNECHLIDFDFDDEGNPLAPGTDIFDQYEDFTVTTENPHRCAQLFDTGNPTSNDFDLGTPNEAYGGPGIGAGGVNNTDFQGNALIVSYDCGVPNEKEGQLIFDFDCSVTIKTVDLLDMKCGESEVELYDEHGNQIGYLDIPAYGVNSFNTFDVNISGVYQMIIDLDCGGGVTGFKYCKDNAPGTDCEAPDLCTNYNLDFSDSGNHWAMNDVSGSFDVNGQIYDISIADTSSILVDTQEDGLGLEIGIDPDNVDDNVVVCYNLSQISDNVVFDITDLDLKDGNSKQQEAVCVYGLLGDDLTPIMPLITSLEGSVDIDGNCAEATTNSAYGHDESVLVTFSDCIDKVLIEYGTGSSSPTANPSYSSITIGESIGFNSEVCPGDCTDCVVGSSGGDDDGDGVCNIDDVCPGGNDNIDSDGDGIPDACDDICYDYNIDHGDCGAGWQHGDESGTVELGLENISIDILDDDNILENTEADGEGLLVGIDPHTVDDELIVCYTLSESSANVVFDITDLDYKNSGSKQQEAVCVYGTLGNNPTPILPTITSLDGHVDIDGNCAEGTVNSAHSHDDESILVEFAECIDKITIVYGTGSNSPTQNPDYSKITIGESIFSVEQCKGGCDEPCPVAGSGGGDGDADDDGVCDGDDICPGGDDFMDTDGDGTPDFCDDDCTAGSSPIGDDDGDFVCNDVDQCPGFDDNIDENNNGIPDGCDVAECEDYTLDFAEHGYDWSGHSLTESYTVGSQTFDVRIIDGDHILTSSHDRVSGLAIGTNPRDVHDEVVICYNLSQVASNVLFDIVDLDRKTGGSRQQEAVCVYGTLGNDPAQIMPSITSLDGNVAIDGNCAEATANSSDSGQDESILVEFTECIDKVTIVYGTGSDSPTHDPDYGKITIGQDYGFVTEVCSNTCPEPRIEDEENAYISLYPNPVYGSSNVTIEIDTKARGNAQIALVDALGRTVSTENIQLVNDLTIHQFSTNSLAAGVYFVQLQTQEWRTDGLKLVVVKP